MGASNRNKNTQTHILFQGLRYSRKHHTWFRKPGSNEIVQVAEAETEANVGRNPQEIQAWERERDEAVRDEGEIIDERAIERDEEQEIQSLGEKMGTDRREVVGGKGNKEGCCNLQSSMYRERKGRERRAGGDLFIFYYPNKL